MLDVALKATFADQIELRFQEIHVAFFVVHQLFEQAARYVVLDGVAMGRRPLVERTCFVLGLEVWPKADCASYANSMRLQYAARARTARRHGTQPEGRGEML
jgi:hypothetical protein